jgi:hypothetical protein
MAEVNIVKISHLVTEIVRLAALKCPILELPLTEMNLDVSPNMCLENCETANNILGYEIAYGWHFYDLLPTDYAEGVFHAVLIAEGQLLDITPRDDNSKHILFVRDMEKMATRLNTWQWNTWRNMQLKNGDFRYTKPIVMPIG